MWEEIVMLLSDPRVVIKIWCVLGDFNKVLNPTDHSTSNGYNVDRATRDLRKAMFNIGLVDLTFRGSTFTWWNKRREAPITTKIDEILINDHWPVQFSFFFCWFFGPPDFSDHASCDILLNPSILRKKCSFRFFNFLLRDLNFLEEVSIRWLSVNVVGSAMYQVSRKLKKLKKSIRDFSRSNFSDLKKWVQEAHEVLLLCQSKTLDNPCSSNAKLEFEALRKWSILVNAEESFFGKKSSVQWLREGDICTSYFMRITNTRKARNHIHFLESANRIRFNYLEEIHGHCIDYFMGILGREENPQLFIQEDITTLLDFRCSETENAMLVASFSPIEIKEAFLSLPKNKASGHDGFPPKFYIALWPVLGGEVIATITEFFTSGKF